MRPDVIRSPAGPFPTPAVVAVGAFSVGPSGGAVCYSDTKQLVTLHADLSRHKLSILVLSGGTWLFPPSTDKRQENHMKTSTLISTILITVAASGCATWDNMSSREKSASTGAAVGGVAGAVISNGGLLGTVGGAAIGGVIGDQVGKKK